MLAALRGDWFCSAFGENGEPWRGRLLPPHGESANRDWEFLASGETAENCWLQLGVDLPVQGGRCTSTTVLFHHQTVIYQRHDLANLSGPINPGHHATLAFPRNAGQGRLSFSRFIHLESCCVNLAPSTESSLSCLEPRRSFDDLRRAPCVDGSTADLTCYPAREGCEDIVLVGADPNLDFAWSAVTLPRAGYAWFALRNPRQLASTLLWFSN
jgi:hypothetical protein